MKISRITLNNFRIYKGLNTILFDDNKKRPISIVAGRNGYGKTTFLTSLVWVFYGKLIAEVEDKYRQDIRRSGGYDSYLRTLINREILNEFESNPKGQSVFSAEVELSDVLNPSIPCEKIVIQRSYDLVTKKESLKVLIDGSENELTKEVGYDVFINDFILPREIAKFFFFDAEKIVALAEAKTKDELRSLSKAYSEVLGIKKYEELKKNLESLLSKLRRDKGFKGQDKSKLDSLVNQEKEFEELIDLNLQKQQSNLAEIAEKRSLSDELQEKLIREGNAITLEELKVMKADRDRLKSESVDIKGKLGRLMELAPLVMAGRKLDGLRDQLISERKRNSGQLDKGLIEKEIAILTNNIVQKLNKSELSDSDRIEVQKILDGSVADYKNTNNQTSDVKVLLDFSEEQYLNFNAVYENVKGTFIEQLNGIVQEEKTNRVLLSRITRKIKEAEARKDNKLAKKYREERESLNSKIQELENENNFLLIEQGEYSTKKATITRQIEEIEKNFKLDAVEQKKYKVTSELLDKLNLLIAKVKEEKKYTLQKSLKLGLDALMHKEDFVKNIRVVIENDLMEIELLDLQDNVINKDSLSKGEQQLYATALLKALVDESGIQFPVFIDSPLQKFDKHHSKNIIEEFYPSISDQVVLLPLLEKELSENEFELLKPNVNKTFVINSNKGSSSIDECKSNQLFNTIKDELYAN